MFANEIVSFTISSISKSPTWLRFCDHLPKTCGTRKNQTISDIPVLFPPQFDKHTFDKQRLRKEIPNRCFVRSIFTNNKPKKKHTHVVKHGCTCLFFASFPLIYKWTKWAKWAAILSELSPLSPLKTN